MRTGIVGWCPDCADERILVAVEDGPDHCCTDCDAAVVLIDVLTDFPVAQPLQGLRLSA